MNRSRMHAPLCPDRVAALVLRPSALIAADGPVITVHRILPAGAAPAGSSICQKAGFVAKVLGRPMTSMPSKPGSACPTISPHAIPPSCRVTSSKGTLPAAASSGCLQRSRRRQACRIRMPVGSPGMEGGSPEPYDVVLFVPMAAHLCTVLGDRAL